mmetsp:Transcript_51374/g.130695  ORF Transcript_51374/g.130695 Transcript_51374/m.130695 type:complete len:490 (+) Transcript_51374:2-1471(+)
MMVLETWVLTVVMLMSGTAGTGGFGNASILRMARLARLSRMARMARLLRAMPELMILIKGISAATRSVFFTLALLVLLMYIFAIMFTQLTRETDVGEEFFNKVGNSMYTLLVYGTLMDQITLPVNALGQLSYLYGALFLFFVLLAALTLMNMLIGVLTEVVSAVAATEKETLTVTFVRNKMQEALKKIDQDGDGTISKREFEKILENKDATEALNEVDVDVIGLVDFADFIFADEDGGKEERTLDFGKFMEVVLQFRGSNNATVKDIVNLRKFVSNSLKVQRDELQELKELVLTRAAYTVTAARVSATGAHGSHGDLGAHGGTAANSHNRHASAEVKHEENSEAPLVFMEAPPARSSSTVDMTPSKRRMREEERPALRSVPPPAPLTLLGNGGGPIAGLPMQLQPSPPLEPSQPVAPMELPSLPFGLGSMEAPPEPPSYAEHPSMFAPPSPPVPAFGRWSTPTSPSHQPPELLPPMPAFAPRGRPGVRG